MGSRRQETTDCSPKIKIKTPKQKPRNRESLTKWNEVKTSLTQ